MALVDKLPYRDGIDIFEARIKEGDPGNWARQLIVRWLPQAQEEELGQALERTALYYWLGQSITPLGRQARKRPVKWDDRSIIWLLGLFGSITEKLAGPAAAPRAALKSFVHDTILLIDPDRPEASLPGRQAFRTTKKRRPPVSDL